MQGKKNRSWNRTEIKKYTYPYLVSVLLVLIQEEKNNNNNHKT